MWKKISGFADEIAKDVDTQFSVLNKLGISYFEVRGVDGKNIAELSVEEAIQLKEKMDAHHIKASSIGSPIGKVKLEEPFEEHFEQFKQVVKLAKVLDSKYIRIFSFYHKSNAEWTERERQEVFCRLSKMIAYAKEQDIILLHENEKDVYGDTIDRCNDLMQALYGSHFKAVFDPANFVQCGQSAREAYEKLKNYIEYMHIKDACSDDGKVVPAGSGNGNIAFILKDLLDNGFEGYLSLEPHLGSFDGLEKLELDDKMLGLPASGEGTFTLAYRALIEILQETK